MIKKRYYLIAEINYSFLRQRHQVFAEMMSKWYDVFFIERVPSRIPSDLILRMVKFLFKKKNVERFQGATEINEIVRRKSYMLPAINPIFQTYNRYRARKLIREAKFGDYVHLFVNSSAIAREAKIQGCKVIFDIIHNWWDFPYHSSAHLVNLRETLDLADIIVSDSKLTLDAAKRDLASDSKPMSLIPPGVEDFWFSSNLKTNSENVFYFAFFGNLRANSDLDLIRKIYLKKNFKISFYGLLDPTLPKEDAADFYRSYKGSLPSDKLVGELEQFDFILLPYDSSKFSKTIFPAKYFEALALGKPVISNSDLRHLPGWNKFVWKFDELEELGAKVIIQRHYAERYATQVNFAREHSWEQRISELRKRLDA